MSISTYDSNDVIDLEHVFDEDRMSHYSSSTNNRNNNSFKPHRISLQSVDDDVLKNLHRSLITPLPPRTRDYPNEDIWYHGYPNRPDSRAESVMLFKNIDNGKEPVTIDFVSSDLNEFMDPYNEDDLMSRPPSRMPQKRRDSLNGFLNPSTMETPSFARPRSSERNVHSSYQTSKDSRRNPLHTSSYTDVLQKRESKKKDNYHTNLRSLRASVDNLIISSSTDEEIVVESPKPIENDIIRKRLENRNNPEMLRKRYSFNVDHSNGPEEEPRRRIVNKESDTRRWSSYIPNKQTTTTTRRYDTLQKKTLVNYPSTSDDELWESQVTTIDPPKAFERPLRVNTYNRTDTIKQSLPPPTTTTRYRKYSNPNRLDDKKPINTVTSIPKRTSKLYELATQREPTIVHSKIITPIVASRSSGELSNSTESSSNSGDLYYDAPPSPPRKQETRKPYLDNRSYRIRTLSEEERMPNRNTLRSKKLSLDSQKPPSVAENARQVLEMVRQRRQQAMSRTH